MFKLDIERLHQDIEAYERGELVNCGTRKTTVLIYKLLGAIEVAPPGSTFIVVTRDWKRREFLVRRVYDEILRNGIEIIYPQKTEFMTKQGVHVMFVNVEDIRYYKLTGIKIMNYFIDDLDVFWKRVKDPEKIIDYLESCL